MGICLANRYNIMTTVTSSHARLASKIDIHKTRVPACRIRSILKFAPRAKAIIPNTKLEIKSEAAMILTGIMFRR